MNWSHFTCYLFVLLISCQSLMVAGETEEDLEPTEQEVEEKERNNGNKARSNDPSELVGQIFRQSLLPQLSFGAPQSVSHNIGYNLGQSIGRTPFMGASLDPRVSASKVVLVLANDTAETAALPQPDKETLKRLVRTPDFFEELVTQMATMTDQLSQHVPEISRSMGEGFAGIASQAPLLNQVQQAGAIDYAKLGQTFGESVLPQNLLANVGDAFNVPMPQSEAPPPPASETERVESELAPDQEVSPPGPSEPPQPPNSPFASMLTGNPLFRNFPQFVPPQLPSVDNNPFMFNPAQAWPWLPQNVEGAASDISEVRVKPDNASPYKIAPKEGLTQTINEMKLRAAMKAALDKKTIPILWFHLSEKNSQDKTKTDEDLKMKLKLEAFEKQLILELQQLQEVVKLANAMKKAQLEAKGKKSETAQTSKPLTLSTTPVYKITLDDIEKTLKDEYVQKLLQMISSSQNKQHHSKSIGSNGKHVTAEATGNPNKRQTSTIGNMASTLNRDDMMKMMAYAYRMAATNAQEMPWLKEENAQTPSATPQQRMEQQPQITNEQQWMMEKQQQMAMETEREQEIAEERKHKGGQQRPHHRPHHGHQQHFIHHHHIGRQTDDPNMLMRQGGWLTNDGQQMPKEQTMREGAWLTNNGQKMPTMSQDQMMRQGGWLTTNDGQQMREGAWLTNGGQTMPTMPQDQTPREGGWLTNDGQQMPPSQTMREGGWLTNEGQAMPKEQIMREGAWLTNAGQKTSTMPQDQKMREGGWLTNDGQQKPQDQQMREGGWLTNDGQKTSTMPQDQKMREGGWLTNDGQQKPQDQQMREGGWLTNDGQQKPEDQKMREGAWLTNPEQMKQSTLEGPNGQMRGFMPQQEQMRQLNMAQQQPTMSNVNMQMRQQQWGLMDENQSNKNQGEQIDPQMEMRNTFNERQMTNNPQMEMNGQQQRQMAKTGDESSLQMKNDDGPKDQSNDSENKERQGENKMQQQPMTTADERQMAKHDHGMLIAGEATPQMPENAGKARHKGFDDLFDEFDIFGHHDKKGKDKEKGHGHGHGHGATVVNYYYNTGGSRYPPVYGSSGGYAPQPPPSYGYAPQPPPSYGYAPQAPPSYARPRPSYGGYGGGGGGGVGGYSAPPKYKPSGYYGGGGYGSNAYGSRGGYRTAVGDDEIQEMLREHQTMP